MLDPPPPPPLLSSLADSEATEADVIPDFEDVVVGSGDRGGEELDTSLAGVTAGSLAGRRLHSTGWCRACWPQVQSPADDPIESCVAKGCNPLEDPVVTVIWPPDSVPGLQPVLVEVRPAPASSLPRGSARGVRRDCASRSTHRTR